MLKKLSIAGLAFIASSGLAFADTNDAMSDTSGGASMSNTSNGASTSTTHKKHRKHKHHHRHHYTQASSPAVDPTPAPAPAAYKADYKGEVAAPCPTCPVPFMAGAYVGLSVGSVINYTSSPSVYNGLQGTLFGGYGWLWDQMYAGLEVFIQDSALLTNNTSPTSNSVRSTFGYGLSVLPGYLIVDNVLGYLRLGVVRTRFSTGNNYETGGQVGLGLDTAICNNWDLRGEYVYSFYNSLPNHGGSPKSQQFNLGLIYKFQM